MIRVRAPILLPVLALAAACGSTNTSAIGFGGDTNGSSSGSTSSGVASSGSTSSGTGAAGTGGGATTSSSTSTSTSSSSSSGASSTSTSSSSSSTSSSSSGAASGACTDSADQAQLAKLGTNLQSDVTNCAQSNLAAEPGTKNCIKMKTMLSDACVACFDTNVQCANQHCLSQCLANPNSTGCTSCIHTNCTPAFNACSGLMGL